MGHGVEELSSERGDTTAVRRGRRRTAVGRLIAGVLVAVVVADVAAATARRTAPAATAGVRPAGDPDRVVVTTRFGTVESVSSRDGRVTSAEGAVLIHNGGRYPVSVDSLRVRLAGIHLVGWRVPDRQLAAGRTSTVHVLVRTTCAADPPARPGGSFTVGVTSAAGRLHHVTTALSGAGRPHDPFSVELGSACGMR